MRDLRFHISRSHEGFKPYECNQRDATFNCSYVPRRHVKNAHENEKPVACDICGRKPANEEEVSQHKRNFYWREFGPISACKMHPKADI
ncbi:hypothetical protein TSMEX_000719 [Taenia solium]|eukprot:TsM_000631300 transcript=TsM_000631300 gene=TsM_000631300